MKKILIVGAGITGATCANILCKNNLIDIIDKNEFIGGNCYDYLSNDKSCFIHKFGPHIFHTLDKNIWEFVNRFDKFNNYRHCVYTKVNDEIYTFPINLNTITKLYNKNVYCQEDVNDLIHDIKFVNPKNFQEAAINAVGIKIYNTFIKNYTEKQWNCKATQLPKEIFNRINIRYNFNNDYFQNQYQGQPINGYTNLIKNMLDNKNIKIFLKQEFNESFNNKYDLIIYTGSLKNLQYRSIYFKHYTSNIDNNYSVLNMPDDKFITRITNFNILHKNTKTNIFNYCEEYPAKNNEFNELYPIYNEKNLNTYKLETNKLKLIFNNIIFAGRLGLYKYFDMDKAILSAFNICNLYN